MESLPPPDCHYLDAATGWLMLKNIEEARAELARIDAEYQNHPEVLDVRWRMLAAENEWTAAFLVAETMVRLHPDELSGWIHRAYSARRRPGGGLETAYDCLQSALQRFPEEPLISYNLACYLAQLNRPVEAMKWLLRTFRCKNGNIYRHMAVEDEDLKDLWSQLEESEE